MTDFSKSDKERLAAQRASQPGDASASGAVSIDPERLAALLDGRLSESAAAELRAELANADDDVLEAYADALAISQELGETAVVSIEQRRKNRWPYVLGLAAAAAVAFVLLRPSSNTNSYTPAMLVAALPPQTNGLPNPVWSGVRGGAEVLSVDARSVRLGALLTDLEVSAPNSAESKGAARAVVSLLDAVPGGGVVAHNLQNYASTDAPLSEADRQAAGLRILKVINRPSADGGAYLEAARLALGVGDVAYFDRHPLSAMSELRTQFKSNAEAEQLFVKLEALTAAKPRDGAAILVQVEALLRELSR